VRDAARTFVLVILLVGLLGTGAELLLLEHDESAAQRIPLVLIGVSLGLLVWCRARPGPSVVRLIRITMVLLAASGAVGVVLHYQGNVEFQREVDPDAAGLELFWKVMRAKAPPALAPGVMVQLGLLGLLYSFKHPALGGARDDS
jgi:hypothetical protein